MFLLPYLGGNQQAGCMVQLSSQEGFREKGESFRGKEENGHERLHSSCKHKHLIAASKKTKWMVKDEHHQISPKCS